MKKEVKESILMVVTVTFTIIQLVFFLQGTVKVNKAKSTQGNNIAEEKYKNVRFSTINDELKTLNNSIISDVNDSGDSWNIKIVLTGNKEEILKSLNKLNNMEKYTINKYDINGNKGCFAVKLDLNRRK